MIEPQRLLIIYGTILWLHCGILHREGGPAFERPDGYSAWYRDGKPYRPALGYADGSVEGWALCEDVPHPT